MSSMQGPIPVELDGRGPLTLRQSDFVATGGEASVYRASGTVVKIYTDPSKMQRDDMQEKIKLLKAIKSPYIVAPQGVVRDARRKPIGFYMPYVEGEPISRVFTTAFRQRERFGDADAITLTARMREAVRSAHAQNALMVDANELNWIVGMSGSDRSSPRVIDVDSWAIGRFGASVIMPSIRDWHTPGITAGSDWFAWGIVSFQVYAGIHPYKGTLDGFASGQLQERMKARASVFHDGVRLNRAVRDFSAIPGPLLDWYRAAFESNERGEPPSPLLKGGTARAALVHRTAVRGSGSLTFQKLFERTGDPVIRVFHSGATLLASGAVHDLGSKRRIGTLSSSDGEVIRTAEGWLLADWVGSTPRYRFIDERTFAESELSFGLSGYRFVRYENRLFLVTERELVELKLFNGARPFLTAGQTNPILSPHATKWFGGMGIQEALGATLLILPFGQDACMTVRVKELDGSKPIAAQAGNRYATILSITKAGSYRTTELTFSADYASYTVQTRDTDHSELNVALLPKGVVASIVTDGQLELHVPTSGSGWRSLTSS